MRFALWAQHVPSSSLTPQAISDVLGISLTQAREWRTDFFVAISPIHDNDLPPIHLPAANGSTPSKEPIA